jgi:hypothetical protein
MWRSRGTSSSYSATALATTSRRATGLIEDRAAERESPAGPELDDDVLARRLLMGLTDQQRNLFAVLEMIKMVEDEQAKREDV